MVEVGHYRDLGNITDKLNGAQGSKCRKNLVYSATLTVSRRICERRGEKYRASSRQDVMGVWVEWGRSKVLLKFDVGGLDCRVVFVRWLDCGGCG